MIVLATKGQQLKGGVQIVTGTIAVSLLVSVCDVPYRDALRQTGYQRRPQVTRVSAFASELRRGQTDVPTSLLLNIRDVPAGFLQLQPEGHVKLNFSLNEIKLYIVDGQHRFLAFKKVYEENPEKWGNHGLQFVLMIGADANEEVNQFYVVNTTAKSVRTDLALDLLKQRAESDGLVMFGLEQKGQRWKVDGQSIVDDLYRNSNVWKGRIQLANQIQSGTIIPAASFVTSLKSLLTNSPFYANLSHEQRVRVLEAYWIGIRTALRAPFDGNHTDYALQKGIGVTAMHEILPLVLEIARSHGNSVFEPDVYREIMAPVLHELSGDNTSGENVSGAAFWLTAPKGGAAGSYSSSAGKRVLLAKLKTLLPEMAVE